MDAGSLPPGARLLHIGIPKTGTTAIQTAAAGARRALLDHGVLYPGHDLNHLEPVCALMRRPFGWTSRGEGVAPPMARWRELQAEISRHPDSRVLISHEFAAESTTAQARSFVSELGPQTHVVITLRSFATLLGSSWQQYVKAGRRTSYDAWLRAVLAGPPHRGAARLFYRRNDQPAIVNRWREVLGPDRVIVVVPDKARPEFLLDTFAGLLDVPAELLRTAAGDDGVNRSMSWPEVEYLRRVNRAVRRRLDWRQYELWVRNGAVARMLSARRPRSGEPRVTLPPWAAERAHGIAAAYAQEVADSGCRILGDVAALAEPTAVGPMEPVRDLPLDAAVAATAGLVSASVGRGADFDSSNRPLPSGLPRPVRSMARSGPGRRMLELNEAVPTARAGDLLAVGMVRAVRQLRHRLAR